ncbi:MAG: PHP domain-containing protein [Elusimicrobia bacterium]|nr:PHP domain-containing protein [Elusimicrobiota bacterium]
MFTQLHNHFIGSFSDSVLRIEETVKLAKILGYQSIAITEHGEMPFVYEFSDACLKYGLKPIFGVEIYFVDDAQESIEKNDKNRFHLLLFAKNAVGYKNLVSLVSESWLKNNYYEKRGLVDWTLLEKYHDGVIATTACFFNQISQAYIKNNLSEAEKIFLRYKSIFKDDFYVEIGKHNIPDEEISNRGLLEFAKKYNVKPVATNDVHYLEIDDWLAHDIVIKTRFDRISSFRIESHHFWFKSEKEMLDTGLSQEFLNNTQEIVNKCEFQLKDNVSEHRGNIESADEMINRGDAAYLSDIEYIEEDKADYYVKSILGQKHPDLVYYSDKIKKIPRKIKPNTSKIAYLPDIKEVIPLKVVFGKTITQFTEKSCQRAGASIHPVIRSPLAEALFSAKKAVFEIFK